LDLVPVELQQDGERLSGVEQWATVRYRTRYLSTAELGLDG
jgi:hypothetical protein